MEPCLDEFGGPGELSLFVSLCPTFGEGMTPTKSGEKHHGCYVFLVVGRRSFPNRKVTFSGAMLISGKVSKHHIFFR